MGKAKKIIFFLVATGIVLLVVGELIARFVVGLGDPPVYRSDENYEYIQVENQDVYRFGHHYVTNEFAMRSLPLSDSDAVRILKIGDSVINGGALTDHDSLASTLLEQRLTHDYDIPVRVLNISSGSWGPDNAAAFLEENGDFQADGLVLVFSSHDLYDNMSFKGIVGNHPSFPSSKPAFALWEGIHRYLLPRISSSKKKKNPKIHGIDPPGKTINSGWVYFAELARAKGIPILAVVHPTTREIKAGNYNDEGSKLVAFLDSLEVPVLKELERGPTRDLYRDDIHYNEKGQRFLSSELYPYLKGMVEESLFPPQTLDTLATR